MTQKEALEIMKMGYNVYLTGEAGTGKTYVLKTYIDNLRKKGVPVAVTASTGIAATHLDGVTIDSWSGLGIRDTLTDSDIRELEGKYHLRKRIIRAKVLIIDEISMIHGARFDLMDRIMRQIRKIDKPFGGLQVVLCGDFFQLPPVTADRLNYDFAFKSASWKELGLAICYLHEPKRQSDNLLLKVLRDIRKCRVNEGTYDLLKEALYQRFPPGFTPTKLYTHNVDVDRINKGELDKIPEEEHVYYMSVLGQEKLVDAMKRSCLAPEQLVLKKNAQVMFVRNNFEKGYINGTLGIVKDFDGNNDPVVHTYEGKNITVEPASWTITEENKIVAQLTQHPLRLAWAITVHKSQGMTLDAAEMDLSKSFVEGMGYVALSRVRTLNGLKLLGINEMALRVNNEVSELDKLLVTLSEQTAEAFKKSGFFHKWIAKRHFMYRLTSD